MIIHATEWFSKREKGYTDREVIEGLQKRQKSIEEWFYKSAKRYFCNCFDREFFDRDKRQEIFQSAFLKLWMEIDNKRIKLVDNVICRQQANGIYKPMTCRLTTFLMAFARTEYRELVRNTREEYYDELFDGIGYTEAFSVTVNDEIDIEEQKNKIVDSCLMQMAPRCVEILTMFYYQGKSLDEILELRKEKNSSKNGLKTAKNKCMNTLRERVTTQFQMCNLNA